MPEVSENGSGYALNFDFVDDYVDCGNNASTNITGSITLEAWVRSDDYNTQSIIKKNGTGTGYELSLSTTNSTNPSASRKFFFRLNSNDTYRINSTTSYPIDGTWMHVAATYNQSTGEMKLFVNGVQEGPTLTGPASIGLNGNNLVIGTDALTPRSRFFDGDIDEVRLWNVARTAEQIREGMSKKLNGNEPGLAGYWNMDEATGAVVYDKTLNSNNGAMINMDPATDRIWSGAALGDASAFDYDPTGGISASITHPQPPPEQSRGFRFTGKMAMH